MYFNNDPKWLLEVVVGLFFSHKVVSNSLQLYGLWFARLLCPWDLPGKNIGVGCYFILQGTFPGSVCLFVCFLEVGRAHGAFLKS